MLSLLYKSVNRVEPKELEVCNARYMPLRQASPMREMDALWRD